MVLAAPLGDRRLVDRDRFGATGDAATDRDALAGVEVLDDGAVDVAVGDELAAARVAEVTDVAPRIIELEARDDDLEATGLERLVVADDVEGQLAGGQLR